MARVLITGVTGFIGKELASSLAARGDKVAGIVRPVAGRSGPPEVTCYPGDLRDVSTIRWVLRDFQPDVICHLGAITPVAYSFDHPQEVTEVNYLGTINLAETARAEVPQLKHFIFASSMEVYGNQPFFPGIRLPFNEDTPVAPNCPYAVAKVAAENYLSYLWRAYNFPAVILRQTNCYGRKDNEYFVVESIITQLLRGGEVRLGDPSPVRNFIFIDDLLGLYHAIIGSNALLSGNVFCTGPDNALTIGSLFERCEAAVLPFLSKVPAWRAGVHWNTRPRRPGEVFYLASCAEKARMFLGWSPKVGLDEGLKRVAEHWSYLAGNGALTWTVGSSIGKI